MDLCMDDDGMPKEDALENLLAAQPAELTLMNYAVIDNKDRKIFVEYRWIKTLDDDVPGNIIDGIGHPLTAHSLTGALLKSRRTKSQFLFMGR
ncbi:MAG: hypothetical protein IPP81_04125 [Chitinophagaceae bacterium]|nr:hypothetical protein [Chitinophagaceae bacterium]